MPIYFQDVEDRRVGTGSIVYDKADFPANFPLARWTLQQDRYLTYWNAFTGAWLNEVMPDEVDDKGNPVPRYPLQINYIKTVCMKHSYVLFGEVDDGPHALAPVRVTPRPKPGKDKIDDALRIRAEELEDFINRVWMDNNGRAIQQDAGLLQQFLGGIVFKIVWEPQDLDLEFGIRLEYVLPDFFLPIWDTGRPDNLLEAWVIYRVPTEEAKIRFGYNALGMSDPLYVEHWTKSTVSITLANQPLKMTIAGETFNYDNMKNPFGFVPFFYVPRERAGSYYGLSLIDDVIELSREMNSRLADISDVISEVSHRDTYMRNVSISPKTQDIGGNRPAINLGVTPPGSEQPDVFVVDPPEISEALTKHPEYLRNQFGRDTFVPGVADGEDEGSQRSALTLAFRMWPLTSKVSACRTYWTTALILIAKRIAQIAADKGVGGITKEHLEDIDWGVNWSPMIPRDREAELNEAVLGIQTNMITPTEGNRKLALTDDPLRSTEEVKKWLTYLASLENTQTDQTTTDPVKGKVKIQTKTQAVATEMKEPGEQ